MHLLKPHDIVTWRDPKGLGPEHRWRVYGVHLGALGQESLVEMESLTHEAGTTGPWEYHPRLFVPEVLLRDMTIIPAEIL